MIKKVDSIFWLKQIKEKFIKGGDESFDEQRRDAIDDAIKALESSRWIPVTERLPDKMGSYITTIDCGKYGFATGQRYFYNDEIGWNDKDVIAWMPLPEPYKKENENG